MSRDMGLGKIFSTTFAPDREVGFRLAVAGSKGVVQVWDTSTNAAVRRIFANRVPAALLAGASGDMGKEDRVVGVLEEESDSDDDDDEEEEEEDADVEDGGVGLNGNDSDAGKRKDGWESMDED